MVLFGTILCIFHFDATGLGFFVKQDQQIENGGITTVTGTELDTLAGKALLPICTSTMQRMTTTGYSVCRAKGSCKSSRTRLWWNCWKVSSLMLQVCASCADGVR